MQPYFSHDIFTRENLKIKRLINAHKMTGYGVFWAIIEFLHNNDNKLLLSELDIIAFDLGVEVSLVESVVKNFNLFSIRKKVVSSARVAQNIKLQKEKSKKAKRAAEQRWKVFPEHASALPTHCERNAIKEKKESKEKEINKIKESKERNERNEKNEIKETETDKTEEMNNENYSKISITSDSSEFFSNFYGTANNVHLTPVQYDSLVSLYGKDIVDTVISELSYKIATGKEPAFDAEFPNAHLVRLDRYARQKIATTGTASRASGIPLRNKEPAGEQIPVYTDVEIIDGSQKIEEECVPPPPEFFEAGERLRRMNAKRKL